MANNINKKPNENGGKKSRLPSWIGFLNIFSIVILIFLLITGIYAQFSNQKQNTEKISLSVLANDIQKGNVDGLAVSGDEIKATYKDKSIKVSQKEADSSLTESLVRFGVPLNKLASTTIAFTEPGGFWYWASALAPFLAPILFLVFFCLVNI
jgi:ATP-dependent Zn protease